MDTKPLKQRLPMPTDLRAALNRLAALIGRKPADQVLEEAEENRFSADLNSVSRHPDNHPWYLD